MIQVPDQCIGRGLARASQHSLRSKNPAARLPARKTAQRASPAHRCARIAVLLATMRDPILRTGRWLRSTQK